MRTDISTIGKEASIVRLFEGSGFVNERNFKLSGAGEYCSAHKIMLEGVDYMRIEINYRQGISWNAEAV